MLYELSPNDVSTILNNGYVPECLIETISDIPVATIELSSLPYRDKINTSEELIQRANAIHDKLIVSPIRHTLRYSHSKKMAESNMPTAYPMLLETEISPPTSSSKHMSLILRDGPDKAIGNGALYHYISMPGIRNAATVFPGWINEQSPTPITKAFASCAVVILRNTGIKTKYPENDARKIMASFLGISAQHVLNAPIDEIPLVLYDFHELHHGRQLKTSLYKQPTFEKFYCEMDADINASFMLKQIDAIAGNNKGKKTFATHIKSRYFGMLADEPQYWFAAAMEDACSRTTPNNFFETSRAVMEIRFRLAEELAGKNLDRISSGDLQYLAGIWDKHSDLIPGSCKLSVNLSQLNKFYSHIIKRDFHENPKKFVGALQEIYVRGAFTNPLSDRLAKEILASAKYFFTPPPRAPKPAKKPLLERLCFWR